MIAPARLAEIYASLPTVPCKRLCGRYCGPIIAYPSERLAMERLSWPTPFSFDAIRGRCGYYDNRDGQRCDIHVARPLICRLFGAVLDPRMMCQFGCQPSRWLTNEDVQRLIDELQESDGKPETALRPVTLAGL